MAKLGGYKIIDLAGKDVETGVNVPEVVDNKMALLISGLKIKDIEFPEFFFTPTTEDGTLWTQYSLYLNYYISVNTETGLVQVASNEQN